MDTFGFLIMICKNGEGNIQKKMHFLKPPTQKFMFSPKHQAN